MLGNIWEWVADHWHNSFNGTPVDDSVWVDATAEAGASRVIRGGSWNDNAPIVRSAYRLGYEPGSRSGDLGFRCARV